MDIIHTHLEAAGARAKHWEDVATRYYIRLGRVWRVVEHLEASDDERDQEIAADLRAALGESR